MRGLATIEYALIEGMSLFVASMEYFTCDAHTVIVCVSTQVQLQRIFVVPLLDNVA